MALVEEENVVWEATPSQIMNLPAFILGSIIAAAATVGSVLLLPVAGPLFPAIVAGIWIVCLFPWLAKVISTKFYNYRLTSQRLKVATGVFSRHTDVLELYRIKDMSLKQPFIMRLFGLSNVILLTSDRTTPEVELKAIRKGEQVSTTIRNLVETLRDSKRVREVDFEGDEMDDGDFEGGL